MAISWGVPSSTGEYPGTFSENTVLVQHPIPDNEPEKISKEPRSHLIKTVVLMVTLYGIKAKFLYERHFSFCRWGFLVSFLSGNGNIIPICDHRCRGLDASRYPRNILSFQGSCNVIDYMKIDVFQLFAIGRFRVHQNGLPSNIRTTFCL